MAELEFKYLNEIDISDSLTDSAHVIVEDGGNIRRAPMNQLVTGGGVSSWNDLEDKPFYEEGSFEEILPETELTIIDYYGTKMAMVTVDHTKMVADKVYTMIWDGVEYVAPSFLVATETPDGTVDLVCIGNPVYGNGEDNGIPFIGQTSYSDGVVTDEFYIVTTSQEEAHTLSISVSSTTIHTLDEKFLPDTIARVADIPEVNYPVTSVNGMTGDVVIEASSGLPEVTAENNGAFLRVVDGAWAIVNLTDVSVEGA